MSTLIGVLIGSALSVIIFNIMGLNEIQPVSDTVIQQSEALRTGEPNNTGTYNPQQTINVNKLQGEYNG